MRFNPRAPRGARLYRLENKERELGFNPRAPRGARPAARSHRRQGRAFQSTRPARGATRVRPGRSALRFVSIHAPRAGRDPPGRWRSVPRTGFNPRAPRGARQRWNATIVAWAQFQSTRPARGATSAMRVFLAWATFQSTRPARGATTKAAPKRGVVLVSIHAPRAGRDWAYNRPARTVAGFNPRAPRGARPAGAAPPASPSSVSIHAPRAGRDTGAVASTKHLAPFQSTRPARGATQVLLRPQNTLRRFNPRAPRGARHIVTVASCCGHGFQSTRPARGATQL